MDQMRIKEQGQQERWIKDSAMTELGWSIDGLRMESG